MSRVRLTSRDRSAADQTPYPGNVNQPDRKDPSWDQYHTFEQKVNHELPDMRHQWQDDSRDDIGFGIPEAWGKSPTVASVRVAANKAVRVAMLLLGEKVDDDVVEAQAHDFMAMGQKAMDRTLQRFADTQALYAEDEKVDEKVEDEADEKKAADEKVDENVEEKKDASFIPIKTSTDEKVDEKVDEKKAADEKVEEKKDDGKDMKAMIASIVAAALKAALPDFIQKKVDEKNEKKDEKKAADEKVEDKVEKTEEKTEEKKAATESKFKPTIEKPGSEEQPKVAADEKIDEKVDENVDEKKASATRTGMNEFDIELSASMEDEVAPDPEADERLASVLFSEGTTAGTSDRKVEASQKKAGISKLGGQPRVASARADGVDISSIWQSAPDVSEAFK